MYNKNMATWLTSDLHFFHKNIITYCNRPFGDEYEMNSEILRVWNDSVADDDTVIVVGDFTAGLYDRSEELITLIGQLKGKKTLVLGNHDHMSAKWYKSAGFDQVVKYIVDGDILLVHKPATEYNARSIQLRTQHKPRIVIHGHIHADLPEIEGHFNVAWDRHRRMINMNEIISQVHYEKQSSTNAD